MSLGLSENETTSTLPKTFTGDENIFIIPKRASGQSYFWRVDATRPDQTVAQGDVWTFTIKRSY